MMFRRTLIALAATAAIACAADLTLLNMVPKDPRMIAGMDLERAKSSLFGQRILGEMKDEDQGFQKFVEQTGFDPRKDLSEVILVTNGGPKGGDQTLILARGNFNPSKISAFLHSQGAKPVIYGGVELWSDPKSQNTEGSVAVLNSSVAIFGKDEVVKAAIDRKDAAKSGLSAALMAKVAEWSAYNDAWFITTTPLTEMGINKDGKNGVLPQGISIDTVRAASAGVKLGSILEITGQLLTRSDKDAQSLVDVVQFVASMIRANSDKEQTSDAVKILDTMQMTTDGPTMKFNFAVPEAQLEKILQNKRPQAAPAKSARRQRAEGL